MPKSKQTPRARATTRDHAPIPFKPVELAIPDEPKPEPTTPGQEWKPPPVGSWPSPEFRRDMIELLQAIDCSVEGAVKVERVRELVRAHIHNGPAVVCTREEWDDAERAGLIRLAQLKGTYGADAAERRRLLHEDDLDELLDAAVDYTVCAGGVAASIGEIQVSRDDTHLVRACDNRLYLVEGLTGGAVRVRLLGRQFGCWVAPMLQTTDPQDEALLVPAFDDVASDEKGAAL
jgi:hypothetical protein